ncbi:DUF3786 domain-containing protein [Desulfitobacterium metallireducens]|uniref:DUF3786 domain-containing protein n=1 Tax=Desulfitobacterium metallireducens DSM 15288 TaxID=871968 RepID=W0EEA6_9FIRM|nr:DUF3786 domain-containing protein [Desulfitobacterium metallireducens]AHF07544.1 hypothetical protein DESME_11405 [Desulfitobacterium metallireducens DSM 15288]
MNYSAAYETSLACFQQTSIEEIAQFSGYPVLDHQIQVNFLGQQFTVEHPSGRFEPEPQLEGELPIFARILILHYLANKSPASENGKFISYKELPGGGIYIQPFTNRAIRPMIQFFGERPERLIDVAKPMGGLPAKLGDAGVTLKVFPKVPVTLVLWGADEEFSASGNILFDGSAPEFLPTEDYAVLASFVVMTLKKYGEQINSADR